MNVTLDTEVEMKTVFQLQVKVTEQGDQGKFFIR